MKQRQSREHVCPTRLLDAGEVDHLIDAGQLGVPPAPEWDAATTAACAAIFDRYVRPSGGAAIPDHAFCDLPRRTFLDYAVQFGDVRLAGSLDPHASQLEPVVLSQNIREWARPRHYAFRTSTEAIFHAILDTARLKGLDCTAKSTIVMPPQGQPADAAPGRFYFGLDYRVLPHAPWRPGTVYLYAASDFPDDVESVPFLAETPIRPRARVHVHPWDWPFLDQVHGADIAAQTERQGETFLGYPWADDPAIHPRRRLRPLIDEVRAYLDAEGLESADLAALGRRFGVGPFVLFRHFQAHFGLSPHAYQTLSRVHRAKRLLTAGLPIARVAAETGFCDQTHLTRRFRAVVGMTPGQYVRAQENPIQDRRPSVS